MPRVGLGGRSSGNPLVCLSASGKTTIAASVSNQIWWRRLGLFTRKIFKPAQTQAIRIRACQLKTKRLTVPRVARENNQSPEKFIQVLLFDPFAGGPSGL